MIVKKITDEKMEELNLLCSLVHEKDLLLINEKKPQKAVEILINMGFNLPICMAINYVISMYDGFHKGLQKNVHKDYLKSQRGKMLEISQLLTFVDIKQHSYFCIYFRFTNANDNVSHRFLLVKLGLHYVLLDTKCLTNTEFVRLENSFKDIFSTDSVEVIQPVASKFKSPYIQIVSGGLPSLGKRK